MLNQTVFSRLLLIICLSFFLIGQGYSEELSATQIVQKVDDLMNQPSSYAKAKMTIITSSGKERTFEYDSWSKNKGEKNLMRYLAPHRVKDQATLMLNNADDIWMYFPRTNRVRKLASHAKKQKMEGSDFSYEDMGSGDSFLKDYTSKKMDDQKIDNADCYQVELIRKSDSDVSYSRLILFVRKDNFVPIRILYYDEDDTSKLLKELTQSHIEVIQNIPTAMFLDMKNESDNTHTTMELESIKYNLDLDDAMFTERGLKK